jgi:hypothetical protein
MSSERERERERERIPEEMKGHASEAMMILLTIQAGDK